MRILVLMLAGFVVQWSAGADAAAPAARLGMNLSGVRDWNSEFPFADLFHAVRPWISQRSGVAWGKGPALDIDAHGWVKRLAPDCWAETFLCSNDSGRYPAGEYTVLYEGEGSIRFSPAAMVMSSAQGRILVSVEPQKGPFSLSLTAVNPENYVRNIRVILPGCAESHAENPWNPDFLRRWRGIASLRFMDWMDTNNSAISRWEDRPKVDDASYAEKGVPIELMVDLANRLKVDPWFCMPHQADDAYVRQFAALVKETLDPGLRVYVEYSNEVWNSGFGQNKWAGEEGIRLGFSDKPWEAAWRFTAYRSVQIFSIWEEVFGGSARLVRVLASQAANPYVSEAIVGFQEAYKHADALAIAPYITCNVSAKDADAALKLSLDQSMDYLEHTALPESVEFLRKQQLVADKYGLRLVAYEGGQHMVGIQGGENNEALTRRFHEANQHPRMAQIYQQYFDAWTAAGGDLFCYFNSVEGWSKWGSWGLLQHAGENPADSPKFMAVMRWAKSRGQDVSLPPAP